MWRRPRRGTIKINVDTSVQEGGGAYFGMVARNYEGGILAATTSSLVQVMSSLLAEAQRLHRAMDLASELGFMCLL